MRRQLLLFSLLALLLSAFYLVHTQYASRQLNAQLHRLRTEGNTLKAGRERLLIAKRSLNTPQKIAMQARQHLEMSPSTPTNTYYLYQSSTFPSPHELVHSQTRQERL